MGWRETGGTGGVRAERGSLHPPIRIPPLPPTHSSGTAWRETRWGGAAGRLRELGFAPTGSGSHFRVLATLCLLPPPLPGTLQPSFLVCKLQL